MGQLKPHRSSWDLSENWIKNFIPAVNIKTEQLERVSELAARLDENIELEKKNESGMKKDERNLRNPCNRIIEQFWGSLKL